MVEPRVFLFLGGDEPEKQKKLDHLKKKILPPQLTDLNYSVFYSDDRGLTPVVWQEAFGCLPTEGAKHRLVFIKIHPKMDRGLQECLIREAANKESRTVLVIDVPQASEAQALVASLTKAGAEVIRFREQAEVNPFDLGRAVVARQPERALGVLEALMRGRPRAEKIIGALFWQWERSRAERRLSDEVYSKGLKLLADTDRRLKTSSAAHRQEGEILEVLVVKLSYLT
jgi:DNA polymerase III delta subunit